MPGINSLPYDIVVGAASIYVAPVGTVFPAVDLATPAAPWVSLGETDGGAQVKHSRTTKKHYTDQSFAPKKTTVLTKGSEVSFKLAQVTLERLAYVLDGQSVTTVAAGAGTAGYKEIVLSALATLPQYAMLIRGPSPYADGYLQWMLPCVAPGDGEVEMGYTKDGMQVLATTWDVLEDPSNAGQFGKARAFTATAL
jgi:hypothetical protein